MTHLNLTKALSIVSLFSAREAFASDSSVLTGSVFELSTLLLFIVCIALIWRLRKGKDSDFRTALDSAGLGLMELNAEREILYINQAFRALSAIPADATNLRDFPAAWRGWLSRHIQEALDQGKSKPEDKLFTPGEDAPAIMLRVLATRLNQSHGTPRVLLWCENLATDNDNISAALEREHTLRIRSQNFIQTLIDVIPRPVYVKDDLGRYILANESFCATHNLSRESVIGYTAEELKIEASHAQATALEDARVMAGAPIFKEEFFSNPEKPGEERFTIISKQSCVDPEGRRVMVGTHLDITPWRVAERELHSALTREQERHRNTHDFIQRLLDALPQPISIRDKESRQIYVNQAFLRDAKLTAEQIIGKRLSDFIKEPARAKASLQEDQNVLAGQVFLQEKHDFGLNGEDLRDLIIHKKSCVDVNNEPVIVVTHVNITEQRQAERHALALLKNEQELRERTQQYTQRLLDTLPLPICIRDKDSYQTFVNTAFLEDAHMRREDVIGKRVADLFNNPERARVSLAEDQEVLAGRPLTKEKHDVGLNTDSMRDLIIIKRACLDVNNQPSIVVTQIDISTQRQSERKALELLELEKNLRERTQQYTQRLIDAIPMPLSVRDSDSKFLFVNAAFLADANLPKEELVGKSIADFFTDPARAALSKQEDLEVLQGAEFSEERRGTGLNGKHIRDIIVHKRSCLDVHGQATLVVAFVDISIQKNAERKALSLLENEKNLRERTQIYIQSLLDLIPHPFAVKDQNGRYTLVNKTLLKRLQKTPAELIGHTSMELCIDPDRAENIEQEDQLVLSGTPLLEERHEAPIIGGETRDIIVSKQRGWDVDQNPIIAISHVDVTDFRTTQRLLEDALGRESSLTSRALDFMQHLINTFPHTIYVKDHEGKILMANDYFLLHRHISDPKMIIGKTLQEVGEAYLESNPYLKENPEELARSRQASHKNWIDAQEEDREVLKGQTILKEVPYTLPGERETRTRIIAKSSCTDFLGRRVIVCASYDASIIKEVINSKTAATQTDDQSKDLRHKN